jgi:tetratricopeptide (TPR) repeat protein
MTRAINLGLIQKIDKSTGKITLKNGPINDMTMVWAVKDQVALNGLGVGDKLRFQAEKSNGQSTVTKIEKAKQQRAERPDRDVERRSTMWPSRSTLTLALVLALGSTQASAEQDEASCTGFAVPLETPGSPQEQRDLLLKQASVCMREGKRAQAVALITELIRRNPSDAEAYMNRGSVLTSLGEVDLGIGDFTTAIRLDPKLAAAWYNRGTSLTHVSRYDSAIADFTEAIRLQPEFALAYCNRGLAETELGRYDEALADYTQAIEQDPKVTYCYFSRGTLYFAMGEYQKAIDDFSKQLEIRTDAKTYSRRGEAYEALSELQNALNDFQAAAQLDPKLESAREGLARLANVEVPQHSDGASK